MPKRLTKTELLEQLTTVLDALENNGVEDFSGIQVHMDIYRDNELQTVMFRGKQVNYVSEAMRVMFNSNIEKASKVTQRFTKDLLEQIYLEPKLVRETFNRVVELKEETKQTPSSFDISKLIGANKNPNLDLSNSKPIIKKCRAQVVKLLDFDTSEATQLLTSQNWIKTKEGISVYTDEPLEPPIYRISNKATERQPSQLFLFSKKGKLLLRKIIKM